MENAKSQQNSPAQELAFLPPDLLALGQKLRRVYPPVDPSPQFREALYLRLQSEARRLQARSPMEARPTLVRRAAVGVAALSVVGLALVVWRSRITSALLDHAQGQLRPAQGS